MKLLDMKNTYLEKILYGINTACPSRTLATPVSVPWIPSVSSEP